VHWPQLYSKAAYQLGGSCVRAAEKPGCEVRDPGAGGGTGAPFGRSGNQAKPNSVRETDQMMSTTARLAALATSTIMLLAACATTHGSLTTSADRLERSSDALARRSPSYSSFSADARELANEAHDFRLTVNDRRADDRDVKDAFEKLSRDYHAVRDGVDRSNSREAQVDLRPVTDAYLDIERALGGYPSDRDRYAGDRDRRDRY